MSSVPNYNSGLEHLRILVLCGALPPPVHGMSTMNALIMERVNRMSGVVVTVPLGSTSRKRTVFAKLLKLIQLMKGFARIAPLMMGRKEVCLYAGISGGFGQFFEMFFVIVARLCAWKVVLHHHSYAYLDRRSWYTSLLTRIAGRDASHVVLSESMGHRLSAVYAVQKIHAISNAASLPDAIGETTPRGRIQTIGFLGNLSLEKGIMEFLQIAENLYPEIQAKVAGPIDQKGLEDVLTQAKGIVTYVGAVYGQEKEEFFNSIDVLLFPTRYRNEAEPLTVLEALQRGIPVIANNRGAISDLKNPLSGLAVNESGDDRFVDFAIAQLRAWNGPAYRQLCNDASKSYAAFAAVQKIKMDHFLESILAESKR